MVEIPQLEARIHTPAGLGSSPSSQHTSKANGLAVVTQWIRLDWRCSYIVIFWRQSCSGGLGCNSLVDTRSQRIPVLPGSSRALRGTMITVLKSPLEGSADT